MLHSSNSLQRTKTVLIICTIVIFSHNIFIKTSPLDTMFNDFYKGRSVLVTGGCGFIGSHLVEKLVMLGADVSVIDNLSSGKRENINSVIDKIILIEESIINPEACLLATKNKDVIFHLAAFVSVPGSVKDPQLCHNINVKGIVNLLEASRINNVKRFVFSSSSAVYGEHEYACTENTPTQPTSPYGVSKLLGEIYCKKYAHSFDIETVIMRYFNVYGSRQDPYAPYAGVVAKFIHNIEHNMPLTIFGDGMQTRDFVPVETIVRANLILGMCSKDLIHAQAFNIATGKSITLLELIDTFKEKYPEYNNEIIFAPARPGDVKNTAANCAKYLHLISSTVAAH